MVSKWFDKIQKKIVKRLRCIEIEREHNTVRTYVFQRKHEGNE